MVVVLRHGVEVLWPSTIAGQWYCELKTHLEHEHPELVIDTETMAAGTQGHEALASIGEPVSADEVRAAIDAGAPQAVFEWVLEGDVDGIVVRGKPDLLVLKGREAQLVVEFKFSRSRRAWPSHHVQAQVYGHLLGRAGFDTSRLVTAVAVFPPIEGHDKQQALEALMEEGTLDGLLGLCRRGRDQMLEHDHDTLSLRRERGVLSLARFEPLAAAGNLRWALDYWRGAREPASSMASPGKCRACVANAAGLCQDALAPPRAGLT